MKTLKLFVKNLIMLVLVLVIVMVIICVPTMIVGHFFGETIAFIFVSVYIISLYAATETFKEIMEENERAKNQFDILFEDDKPFRVVPRNLDQK